MRKFIKDWWLTIFYIFVIIGFMYFSVNNGNSASTLKSSNHSSDSGIYYSDSCPITTCNDGACSSSTGRGTCSHHGGIRN